MPETITTTTLQLNDDRTITVPVKGREPIVLPEPSLGEMADMFESMIAADVETRRRTTEQNAARNASLPEDAQVSVGVETRAVRYSRTSPYATALAALIKVLAGDDVDPASMYGWAGSPQAMSSMFAHWQAPLDGRASQGLQLLEMLEEQAAQRQPASNGTT